MSEETMRWHAPTEAPFVLQGFAWFARDRAYHRLPKLDPCPFRPDVDYLAANTAGGQIRFRTDSAQITLRVTLTETGHMDHMPPTGSSGFDCYVGAPGEEHFVGVTRRGDVTQSPYEAVVMNAPDRQLREITINFPLYQGVREVLVGLAPDARVLPPSPFADDRPVVVYGTSITQGGCANRPGMACTNILSRRMRQPFINLGFSGNGKGEPEVAAALADIADPAAYVLDYEANAGLDGVKATLENVIATLRAAHPATPILVVSRIRFAQDLLNPEADAARLSARDFQRDTVAKLADAGDAQLYFLDGGALLGGDDFFECTVDGVHPTDLGFLRMAEVLQPVLNSLLADRMVARG